MNFTFLIKTTVLIFLFSFQLNAQVKKDTLIASGYYNKAESFKQKEELDSALVYFDKAKFIYESAKSYEKTAACYNHIAKIYENLSNPEKSLFYAKKALKTIDLTQDKFPILADTYNLFGKYYLDKSDHYEALKNFKKSLEIRKKYSPKNYESIAQNYNNLGLYYSSLRNLDSAHYYFSKAIKMEETNSSSLKLKLGDYYNNMGTIYLLKGEYLKAENYFYKFQNLNRKKNLKKKSNYARYLSNIGVVKLKLGKIDEGIDYSKRAIQELQKNKKVNNRRVAFYYNNIGVGYKRKGDYNIAIDYYKKSLGLKKLAYGNHHINVAGTLGNIGNVYLEKGEFSKALKYHKEALKMIRKINPNHPKTGSNFSNIGDAFLKQNNLDSALFYYKKALTSRIKNKGKIHPKTSLAYSNLGSLYFKKKEYNKSLKYFHASLEANLKIYGKKSSFTAKEYNNIAKVFLKKKNFAEAVLKFNNALESNLKYSKNRKRSDYFDKNIALTTINSISNIYKQYYGKTGDLKYQEKIIKYYSELDTLIESEKKIKRNFRDRLAFSKKTKEIYKEIIEGNFFLFSKLKEKKNKHKAFYYNEKSKANTLKELLSESHAIQFSVIPKEIIALEQDFKIKLAFYKTKITNELQDKNTDSIGISQYQNKIFDISRRQDSLITTLEQEYPDYYQLKHDNSFLSVQEIQDKLKENTTLLEFFTTDSTTHAFTLTKSQLQLAKINTPQLTEQIKKFKKTITDKSIQKFKTQSQELYHLLLDPIKDQIRGNELIIIPDGPLWHLNFELLLTQQTSSNDPKNFPYLLKDYAISYANAANVLFNSYKKQTTTQPKECLAFSFSDSTKLQKSEALSFNTLRNAYKDLPGTRKEIKAISEITDGNYFYGSQAIERNFKKNADQYRIIHLALHGVIDNEKPENSKLYFTKSKDSIEDNILYGHELFALDIPAELVVLSACNTGSGKIANGEGIMSLGNAFQYAGAKSLLLTNWEVPDDTTPEIMRNFYTHLSSKMSKSKALQQAKLQYLSTAEITKSHPFYWGGFYVLGNNKSIDLQTPFNMSRILTWSVLFIFLLCVGVFIVLKRRKKAV